MKNFELSSAFLKKVFDDTIIWYMSVKIALGVVYLLFSIFLIQAYGFEPLGLMALGSLWAGLPLLPVTSIIECLQYQNKNSTYRTSFNVWIFIGFFFLLFISLYLGLRFQFLGIGLFLDPFFVLGFTINIFVVMQKLVDLNELFSKGKLINLAMLGASLISLSMLVINEIELSISLMTWSRVAGTMAIAYVIFMRHTKFSLSLRADLAILNYSYLTPLFIQKMLVWIYSNVPAFLFISLSDISGLGMLDFARRFFNTIAKGTSQVFLSLKTKIFSVADSIADFKSTRDNLVLLNLGLRLVVGVSLSLCLGVFFEVDALLVLALFVAFCLDGISQILYFFNGNRMSFWRNLSFTTLRMGFVVLVLSLVSQLSPSVYEAVAWFILFTAGARLLECQVFQWSARRLGSKF